jgi:uncharacterized protein YfaS (alpha-2-macroglobulin family)
VADGQWQQEPDYVKALELFQRLTREFSKGETRYYDQAVDQIRNIAGATLAVTVSNIFLPNSELQFALNARNVRHVDLALYKVDLNRDVRFSRGSDADEGDNEDGGWIQKIPLAGQTALKTWRKDLNDQNDHRIYSQAERIDAKLPIGAYVLEAKSGSLTARDLLLISDVAVVLKSSGKQALVYFSNAMTGAPVPNSSVTVWESYYVNNKSALATTTSDHKQGMDLPSSRFVE